MRFFLEALRKVRAFPKFTVNGSQITNTIFVFLILHRCCQIQLWVVAPRWQHVVLRVRWRSRPVSAKCPKSRGEVVLPIYSQTCRPKTIKFLWRGKSTLSFAFESQPVAPGMEDVTYLPHSTANACNEIIRKVDTALLATSPGSSTLSTLDNSNCNRTIVAEILQISRGFDKTLVSLLPLLTTMFSVALRVPTSPNKIRRAMKGQSLVVGSDFFKALTPRISLTHYVT